MNRSYIVNYVNDKEGINRQLMREQLQTIGTFKELFHSARMASWLLIPDEEMVSATIVKNRIFPPFNPFEDHLSVVRIDANDVAETDGFNITEFCSKCSNPTSKEPLNFSRSSSRHDAFIQYKLERPMWIYDDGIQYGVGVEFSEWCWLPVKEDGMYKKSKYEKYIKG